MSWITVYCCAKHLLEQVFLPWCPVAILLFFLFIFMSTNRFDLILFDLSYPIVYITGLFLFLLGVGRYVLLTGCAHQSYLFLVALFKDQGLPGPTFYIILKSDLNPLSANNVLSMQMTLIYLCHSTVMLAWLLSLILLESGLTTIKWQSTQLKPRR